MAQPGRGAPPHVDVVAVRERLLGWYDAHRRDLPWRAEDRQHSDPYAVFVSEVMLQQTRVATVLRHFAAWMQRFPDWHTLASASEQDVLAQWAGLGYYRRARNLHAAARHVRDHGLPQDADGLRALPGVGPYMAGAVASIALGQRVAAVDGNVVRVMSRLVDLDERVDRAPGRRLIERLAADLVDARRPGDWNQALMELGATVCTPRPDCARCPVALHCAAKARGTQSSRPVSGPKAAPRVQAMHFALVRQRGLVLVVPRPERGLLAGTWMLPGGPCDESLEHLVEKQVNARVRIEAVAGQARHVFTHRVWEMRIHEADVEGGPVAPARWVDPAQPDVALSAACRKAIAVALAPCADDPVADALRPVSSGGPPSQGAERQPAGHLSSGTPSTATA